MVGYTESLTDPSYCGQILLQTYPLIGNYGVPPPSLTDSFGVPLHFESERIQVAGYAVSELQRNPSHWSNNKVLNDWLKEEKIPGIERIDTRELTKKLRTKGTMLGTLKVGDEIDLEELKEKAGRIEDPNEKDLVRRVTVARPLEYNTGAQPTVVLIDCGVKYGILRDLLAKGVGVARVPYDLSADDILAYDPSGILVSNGPGDPKRCERTIATVKALMETGLPMMGICLGNQILALAAGADTYKLKFGHRGQNQPCVDLKSGRCYITSQNHGYAIEPESLKRTTLEVWFLNVNDKTVEGIRHKTGPVYGVQFHPEASPGPHETEFLFDEFVKEVKECRN